MDPSSYSAEPSLAGYENDDGSMPPQTYLSSLNILLVDGAEDWAESHLDAIELLNEEARTQYTIDNLRSLLCERFPAKAVEVTPVPLRAKDRATGIRLSLLKSAMSDNIIRAFIKGIAGHTISQEAARGMVLIDSLSRNIYNVAEETQRTNIEIQKVLDEELKADELEFYE